MLLLLTEQLAGRRRLTIEAICLTIEGVKEQLEPPSNNLSCRATIGVVEQQLESLSNNWIPFHIV